VKDLTDHLMGSSGASAKLVDPFTSEIARKRGGKVVQTATFVVSKDGRVITITAKGTNADGTRVNTVTVWDKQ
jgi:hypothetical protein